MASVSKFESPAADYAALNSLNLHDLIVGAQHHAIFFARAVGDNLRSIGLFDGDVLVANRAATAKDGDVVIAIVDDEFVTRIFDQTNRRLICDSGPAISCEGIVIEAVVVQSVRCFRKLMI
ncbi:S24 family peptidase [Vibrio parahaemolyticus]|uniref:S24 family peptidase n=1 Tax=Vibrio parahaemolyticus TaxID=670 RepID=UPI0008139730|nr:S24 family peptidase [Vibrio parahaemolyticus]OCP68353.1 hypothetical protein AKH08_16185 [Vibrio parahaemolyticus]GHX44106.1 DNA polymerase V, subunit D [Vibrio cholerae]